MIDSHAHIYAKEFDNDRDEVVQRALDLGINKILLPNIDLESIEPMLATQAAYPTVCHSMMGLHPCYVNGNIQQDLAVIRSWFEKHNFIAVGEIGIDLYWDKTYQSEQEYAFQTQLQWAKELNLPVVIHTRDSIEQTLEDPRKRTRWKPDWCFPLLWRQCKTSTSYQCIGLSPRHWRRVHI